MLRLFDFVSELFLASVEGGCVVGLDVGEGRDPVVGRSGAESSDSGRGKGSEEQAPSKHLHSWLERRGLMAEVFELSEDSIVSKQAEARAACQLKVHSQPILLSSNRVCGEVGVNSQEVSDSLATRWIGWCGYSS